MNCIIVNIENHLDILRTLTRQQLINAVYVALMMSVVSLKHPGFLEEIEWRLIHSPDNFPSDYVKSSTEIIDGVPQLVYKIILSNNPQSGINGIELPQLLDRIIIGPSEHSLLIYDALSRELTESGVEDAAKKIVISGIPLRT